MLRTLTAVVLIFITAGAASAAVYVKPGGTGDGSTWDMPLGSIQQGIDAASASGGGEVWVARGVYYENIVIPSGVHLYGGFRGCETALYERDPVEYVTVIDGAESDSVVKCTNISADQPTIDGFTIRNGSALQGGGIYVSSASPSIVNNIISDNTATYGGGIYLYDSTAFVFRNTVTRNKATCGAGVRCAFAPANIVSNLIIGNASLERGGGIRCYSANALIANNTVVGNKAKYGGGLRCNASSPVVVNTIFYGNSADDGGAAWRDDTSSPNFINCCFYDNGPEPFYPVGWDPLPTNDNFEADPLFLAPWADEYHLRAGSPCIDRGEDSVVQPTWRDFDDNPRVFGSHVDVGCFECDDGPYWVRRVYQAKAVPEPYSLELRNKLVAHSAGASFWVEERDRTCALRMVLPAAAGVSGGVDVWGRIGLAAAERCVLVEGFLSASGCEEESIEPLAMPNRSLGGADFFWNHNGENCGQQGVTGGSGQNTIGLLVRTWGRVTEVDTDGSPDWFKIDDGSGVLVIVYAPAGITLPEPGQFVIVKGISSCAEAGSPPEIVRTVLIGSQTDLVVL